MGEKMNQKKSYVWMYVILTYFIITLVFGIPSLFSKEKRSFTTVLLGETGSLIDIIIDVILMIILALAILGLILKLKAGWNFSLTYVALVIIGIMLNFTLILVMPSKISSAMSAVYGVTDIEGLPYIFIFVVAIIATFFQLLLYGLIGRYIYKNRSYFRR